MKILDKYSSKFVPNEICFDCKKEILRIKTETGDMLFDVVPVYRIATVHYSNGWKNFVKQYKQNALPIHLCEKGNVERVNDSSPNVTRETKKRMPSSLDLIISTKREAGEMGY